jgi:putative hydrolase of the HAD superfamily
MANSAQPVHITGVIFDYGRVLAWTQHQAPRAAWERRLGLAPGALTRAAHNEHSWMAAQRGTITVDAHWQEVGTALGLTAEDTVALRAAFYAGDMLNTELVACIDRLRAIGLRVGLLSNFSADLRTMLAQQDLLRRFDALAISAELGVMKPDAAAYRAVLAMLGMEPHTCIFIDDIPANVAAAQAVGIHGIVFEDNPSCLAALMHLLGTSHAADSYSTVGLSAMAQNSVQGRPPHRYTPGGSDSLPEE